MYKFGIAVKLPEHGHPAVVKSVVKSKHHLLIKISAALQNHLSET
jgi:hypothetical protein